MNYISIFFIIYLQILSSKQDSQFPQIFHSISDDYKTVYECRSEDYNFDQTLISKALNEINLRWIDSISFIILGIIAFFSTLFIIVTFIVYPKMREPPGDILLGISLSEFVLILHWMISASYFLNNPDNPPNSESSFCLTNAVFSMIGGTYEFLYNCLFCIFLIWKVRNVLKGGNFPSKYMHILCFLITLTVILVMGLTKTLGKNLFGTCSIKAITLIPIGGPLLFIIYVFLSISAIIYFKKTVPKDDRFKKYREDFLNYYYKYVRACTFIWCVLAICNIISVFNCQVSGGGIPELNIFLTIGNIFKLFSPIVLSLIRYQDPFLKGKVQKLFKKNNSENNLEEELVNLEKKDEDIWINVVQNDLKVKLTYTIISGILFDYNNNKGKSPEKLKKINLTKKKYVITPNTLKECIPEVYEEIFNKNFKTYKTTMYKHNNDSFNVLLSEETDIDLNISLNLIKNYEQIQKASGSDGGKGGEFFFFSYDNKIILKTLTNDDLKMFNSIFKDYYTHLKTNQNSLITRILGIYTFESKEIDEKIHIFLMRNISDCPRNSILATYDLKGSTYDREVFKKKKSTELKKFTLKDLDFDSFEKKLYVEENFEGKILEILESDSKFFQSKGLIDYSLLVFKINKENYEGKELKFEFKSKKEKNIVYHIGIIDYLQPYNISKKVERGAKMVLNFNTSLDTSSQDPIIYQKRFMEYMRKIIN